MQKQAQGNKIPPVVTPLFVFCCPLEVIDMERLRGTNHKTIQFIDVKKNVSTNSECREMSYDYVSQTLPCVSLLEAHNQSLDSC